MPLNSRLLRVAVTKGAEKFVAAEGRKLAELDFETKKEQFLDAFDTHPVTKELEGGPTAMSSIPAIAEAEGNLFSFLGFYKGEKPAAELRSYLDKSIRLQRGRTEIKGNKIIYTSKVVFPTVEEVDQEMARRLPLDWVSRAFTQLISKGIPGLPNFLFRESPPFKSPKPSRSSTAIQTKGTALRGGSFGGVPYIGDLLKTLKALFASRRSKR
jgi:hypothetical protein